MIRIIYLFRTQPPILPTPAASSEITFDPFESLQQTASIPNNPSEPVNSLSSPATANKTSPNDFELFMVSAQPSSSISVPPQQQQQQQPFVHPPKVQQSQQPIMFSSNQQQFNNPNNNSFNVC